MKKVAKNVLVNKVAFISCITELRSMLAGGVERGNVKVGLADC